MKQFIRLKNTKNKTFFRYKLYLQGDLSVEEHVQEYRKLAYPTSVWAGVDTETQEVARDSKQGNTDQRMYNSI